MQTNTISKPASIFSSIRIHVLKSEDKAKAMASCVIANAFMITGIKVVDGKFGLFISMPQRKNNTTGEYTDVAFPISKEMREEMNRQIIDEFERVVHSQEATTQEAEMAAVAA